MLEKSALIRIAKDGQSLFVDRSGKQQGRGAYVCKSLECIAKAAIQRGIERSIWQKKHRKSASNEGKSGSIYEQLAFIIKEKF